MKDGRGLPVYAERVDGFNRLRRALMGHRLSVPQSWKPSASGGYVCCVDPNEAMPGVEVHPSHARLLRH